MVRFAIGALLAAAGFMGLTVVIGGVILWSISADMFMISIDLSACIVIGTLGLVSFLTGLRLTRS